MKNDPRLLVPLASIVVPAMEHTQAPLYSSRQQEGQHIYKASACG